MNSLRRLLREEPTVIYPAHGPRIPDGVTVIASAFETEIDRYSEVCKRLSGVERIAGIEINASCPHVKSGGIEFGQNPRVLAELVRSTRRATPLPLLVKLSPNVTDIAEMARVCAPGEERSRGFSEDGVREADTRATASLGCIDFCGEVP